MYSFIAVAFVICIFTLTYQAKISIVAENIILTSTCVITRGEGLWPEPGHRFCSYPTGCE